MVEMGRSKRVTTSIWSVLVASFSLLAGCKANTQVCTLLQTPCRYVQELSKTAVRLDFACRGGMHKRTSVVVAMTAFSSLFESIRKYFAR